MVFSKILIVSYDDKTIETVDRICEILSKNNIQHLIKGDREGAKNFAPDLVLVVGGDGSMLSAAKEFADNDIHFLGINLGKVGFMADLESDNLESKLVRVLNGENRIEEKEILNCSYNDKGYSAFNELVLHTEKSYKLLEFEVAVDNVFVYRKRADGLIISTSNGSTAYSLSAGGPILYPELNAFVITSLNPLSLSARPLIVSSNSEVRVTLSKQESQLKSLLIFDGNQEVSIQNDNNEFVVKKSEKKFRLVHPQDHDFFNVCRNKLSWSLSRDET
jgi:NAD+ kinase|tara:strand:- start:4668 stop:5495 length:828 start_codon:yes stop_codon:yes gene_type:complete